MTLNEYLKAQEISHRSFAKALGVSNATVSNIARGKRPSKKHAKLIENMTYGKIRASDLLKQEKWIQVVSFK